MSKVEVNREEWLAELFKVKNAPRDGFVTVREMMKKTGRCEDAVRRGLYRMNEAGRLIAKTAQTTNLLGRPCHTVVYKIKAA